jgi:DNA-binding transcriptional ArsR family regulator
MDATMGRPGTTDAGPPEIPFARAAEIMRALAHPVRLKIVDTLRGGELCVKGLEEALGVSQSSVSQHLSRLRYAGLIEFERRGHLVCYRLAGPRAEAILLAVVEGLEPTDRKAIRTARSAAGSSEHDEERAGRTRSRARPGEEAGHL